MQKKLLGKTGHLVSAVGYGGIVSAANYAGFTLPGDGQAASDYAVSWAIERGVNYFDVAPTYGDAERMLGSSLRPYRKNVYLACKTTERTRAGAEAEMRASMEHLCTDYFDTYQLHGLSTMEELEVAFGPGGVMELLVEMQERGLARRLGITSHNEDVVLRALELFDFDSVMFPLNWHMHMARGMGDRLLAVARERNIGVLCMKSLIECMWRPEDGREGGPRWKYPKSWCKPIDVDADPELLLAAMKYVASLGVDTILPPGNFDHFQFAVEHIAEATSEPLSDGERQLLAERFEMVKDRPFF